MNKFFLFVLVASLLAVSCNKFPLPYPGEIKPDPAHHLKNGINTIVEKYIGKGIPGLQVVVKDNTGWYITQGGYASRENHVPMKGDNATWIFSITKTYTAALIMQCKERNLIGLDEPISQYLPAAASSAIINSHRITVRQLLNHSSGIVNFIELDAYRKRQFDNPLHQPSVAEIVEMVRGQEAMFEPGAGSYYSNTNYLLLGIILEHTTHRSYESLLHTGIIGALQLKNTFYNLSQTQIAGAGLPDYYTDLDESGQLQNTTAWNTALGNASGSWGGIAATPTDVIRFYDALTSGRVVKRSSLLEMQQYHGDFGLGIESYVFENGAVQFGHEGDGVGNSTMILYVPTTHAFIFINCTVGRQLPTPFLQTIIDLKNELCGYVVRQAR